MSYTAELIHMIWEGSLTLDEIKKLDLDYFTEG